jgi:DNA repair exonuclease SbcCD ATPase subunit
MSLILKSLSLRNFLGFGNKTETIDLSTLGTTLLVGENVDKGGANGVGKTTIGNGISYALFNVPLEKISKDRLINTTNNTKNTSMVVSLDFEVDGVEYTISRSRGAHTATVLLINGEDKTPDSIENTNKAIVDIIGVSFELFRRSVVFLGGDQPFFEMPVSQQRQIIEELFKITTLSEKADLLKKQNISLDKDIEVQATIIQGQERARNLRAKHIADAEARTIKWESDKEANVDKLTAHLKKISSIDFDTQEELHKRLDEVTPVLAKAKTDVQDSAKQLAVLGKALVKNESELGHLEEAKCPYCLQKFEDAAAKISELHTHSADIEFRISGLETSKSLSEGIVDSQQIISTELQNGILHSSYKAMLTDKGNVAGFKSQLEQLEASTNPHIEVLDTLMNEEEVKVDYSKLDQLKSDMEHGKFLLKLLTDKNSFIRKKIISKSVPFLNKQLFEHSHNLGLPHIVSFNPDMSCTISEYGRELDYGNLSGGQKKRLNLALSLAFRDMLQHLHANISILIVDEVDGGAMDVLGVEAIIKVLKDIAVKEDVGIWVISHRPECAGRFDREMLIKFENGFSAIDGVVSTI